MRKKEVMLERKKKEGRCVSTSYCVRKSISYLIREIEWKEVLREGKNE